MSGRSCSACADARRPELDAAIATGESFRAIARRFAPLSRDAIRRHRAHVGTAIVLAAKRREENLGDSLLGEMRTLQARTLKLLDDAERAEDGRLRAVAISQVRENVALFFKLTADLKPPPTTVTAWAAAERGLTVNITPLHWMMDGYITPHEALVRLVEQGYLTQNEAETAMLRHQEAEKPLKALGSAKQESAAVAPYSVAPCRVRAEVP